MPASAAEAAKAEPASDAALYIVALSSKYVNIRTLYISTVYVVVSCVVYSIRCKIQSTL